MYLAEIRNMRKGNFSELRRFCYDDDLLGARNHRLLDQRIVIVVFGESARDLEMQVPMHL